mmetsp:Transcript_30237/g.64840  ORF Transcript_30237/g.64840 Transcript_30237/m.64840 type:complete len:352 (-) Transcript_30237:192-1247(-)
MDHQIFFFQDVDFPVDDEFDAKEGILAVVQDGSVESTGIVAVDLSGIATCLVLATAVAGIAASGLALFHPEALGLVELNQVRDRCLGANDVRRSRIEDRDEIVSRGGTLFVEGGPAHLDIVYSDGPVLFEITKAFPIVISSVRSTSQQLVPFQAPQVMVLVDTTQNQFRGLFRFFVLVRNIDALVIIDIGPQVHPKDVVWKNLVGSAVALRMAQNVPKDTRKAVRGGHGIRQTKDSLFFLAGSKILDVRYVSKNLVGNSDVVAAQSHRVLSMLAFDRFSILVFEGERVPSEIGCRQFVRRRLGGIVEIPGRVLVRTRSVAQLGGHPQVRSGRIEVDPEMLEVWRASEGDLS